MATLDALQTPAALVDLARVKANCLTMQELAARHGVLLRPHVKTHKCVELARLQLGAEAGPITVSTLAEAHHFASAGFEDQVLAVPLAPGRIPEALALVARLQRFTVLVDDPVVARQLAEAAQAEGLVVPVLMEVDCGYGRTGVVPGSPRAMALARLLHASPSLELRGLLTHGGHGYGARDRSELLAIAREERDAVLDLARVLRAAGIPVPVVSIGSTPTLSVADELEGGLAGVTEIRPGNYVFYDLFQAAIGSCTEAQVALSVLGTVIGRYPEAGRLVTDTGSLAMSADAGATHTGGPPVFGHLLDPQGAPLEPPLRLGGLSQEHGKIYTGAPLPEDLLPVGSRVRILPNHSCLTAAQHPVLTVVDDGQVVDTWRPCRGW